MRGKFVWCDGYIKTAEGYENTKARPLHHIHLLEALEAEGKIILPSQNFLCGWYSIDPFHSVNGSPLITGREGLKVGNTPSLDECLQMILDQQPKMAKYDYAATLEKLAVDFMIDDGQEILRIIRETGGGTFLKTANGYDPLYETQGYYVSVAGKEKTLPLNDAQPTDIIMYADANVLPGQLLGTWVDDDLLYLDVSKHILDYNEAIEFGKVNNQLAIWDAGNSQEIRLDKMASGGVPIKGAWTEIGVDEFEEIAA